MGLERLAVVVQDADSLFTVDTNKALLDRVCELAGKKYLEDPKTDMSLRLSLIHIWRICLWTMPWICWRSCRPMW